MVSTSTNPANPRVRRKQFTPLGIIYYQESHLWQRVKIESEILSELGIKRYSLRPYMVSTAAYRMRKDMKAIILRTLPQAADCFNDPRTITSKNS